jgi:DnaJ homolog subfamily C member 3
MTLERLIHFQNKHFSYFCGKKTTSCISHNVLQTCYHSCQCFYYRSGAESSSSKAEIERHLELGRDFLARGQLQDALTHYHAAVEGDSRNYLTFFKRGTVYLALGKAKLAISDLDRALELKPDFATARSQRGTVYLKMGDYNNAEIDLYHVLQEDPHNEEAHYLYSRINPAREQIDLVHDVISRNDHQTAIALLTQLLEVSPWCAEIRELRGESYLMVGDRIAAVSDFRSVNRLMQDGSDDLTNRNFLKFTFSECFNQLSN